MKSTLASFGLGLAAATLSWAQAAQAQEECRADADCGADRRCEKPVSIDGCAEPPCDAAPEVGDVGWCVPAALGNPCSSDADCGDELECMASALDKPCSSDQPDCAADSSAPQSRCEYPPPEPLLCDADDHCAPPFACDAEQDEHACYFPDQTCDADADCLADFECVDGAAIAGDCQECDKDAGGGEPVCRSVPCEPGPNQCSPRLIACDSDGDCPAQWLCREIGYDFKASQWSDDVLGTEACVPGGLVQVAEGNYYLGGFAIDDVADGVTTAGASQAADTGVAKGEHTAAEPGDDDDKAAADDDGKAMSESSGCAVALPSSGAAFGSGGWLALGLIALGLQRRRR